ncbi:MAG: pilus assembly protein [Alphaproteobacteria bacterium RIFCSPHIGHO2_12_FULL_66_14]|nr:MAG: pilus assembly protein [Alphaproteobacteria bacterium RIFCSPHIGHO2_12_FULL_66_14]
MTWSIIFHERPTGRIGIAVATKFFAVGARVPNIEPQKGAVCTQALTNPLYGPRGLRLIREGIGAADIVRLLTTPDAGREHRQIHVMGADGKFGAHTGAECVPWCGHWIGDDYSVAGNMLAGPAVVSETVRVLRERTDLALPRRLIAAMRAGEAAGGDKRGKQSAALVIYGNQEYSELDLRVDDHIEPLLELARLEAVSRERWTHFRAFVPTRENPAGIFDRAEIDAGIERSLAAERK